MKTPRFYDRGHLSKIEHFQPTLLEENVKILNKPTILVKNKQGVPMKNITQKNKKKMLLKIVKNH